MGGRGAGAGERARGFIGKRSVDLPRKARCRRDRQPQAISPVFGFVRAAGNPSSVSCSFDRGAGAGNVGPIHQVRYFDGVWAESLSTAEWQLDSSQVGGGAGREGA